MKRRKTRNIYIGRVGIGSDYPIVIQSMTNLPTKEKEKVIDQIKRLYSAGAEIIRLAVLDKEDANALSFLVEHSPVPLIADIHFDWQLALLAIEKKIAGLRLNPGNITEKEKIKLIVEKAGKYNIPIRIGVNAGSLDKNRYPHPTPQAMVESALHHIEILESLGFYNIKVSLKASRIRMTIEANRLFARERDYPIHLGITEAGTYGMSAVRSAIGIGTLLLEGIGDTIRVSVSGDPVQEISIAKQILLSLDLKKGIYFVSCPTCGRTSVDVEKLTQKLEENFGNLDISLTIAVMGCTVNGPGEAKEADIALIGGKEESLIYLEGVFYKKVANHMLLEEMKKAIEDFIKEKKGK